MFSGGGHKNLKTSKQIQNSNAWSKWMKLQNELKTFENKPNNASQAYSLTTVMSAVQKLEKSWIVSYFSCLINVFASIKSKRIYLLRGGFLTCWFSVFIEKAEMSNKVLRINPNDIRIHIICKQDWRTWIVLKL